MKTVSVVHVSECSASRQRMEFSSRTGVESRERRHGEREREVA